MSTKNLESSGNDGKFKSSQMTQYDTLENAEIGRNQTMMSNNQLHNNFIQH